MITIREYVDFSIKYKYVVGNKLPIELKKYVWKEYLKLIALDKIISFSNRRKKKV
tara:strand:- start:271 stop:435 length:165 start_codon:yes stop_codon:yes gene_type:complete